MSEKLSLKENYETISILSIYREFFLRSEFRFTSYKLEDYKNGKWSSTGSVPTFHALSTGY